METTGMHGSAPHGPQGSSTTEQMNEKLHQLSDSALNSIDRFKSTAADYAGRVRPRIDEWMHTPTVEKTRVYMREHPMAAVGIAIAVGLVLSRLLSSRR